MTKIDLSKIANDTCEWTVRHSPELLTGIGISGMAFMAALVVDATVKAVKTVEAEKKQKQVEKLDKADVVKLVWKYYIPAAIAGATSTACIVGASKINFKRNAALATAYTLSETALREYQGKVVETIGEKKEQVVRDAIANDHIERNPVSNTEVVITDRGNTLCYDMWAGRYFRSDIDKIRKAVNELNRTMLSDMYISLNDFYCEIGLPPTKMGDELGWNIDRGLIDIYFSAHLSENDEPCLAMNFNTRPDYKFSNLL